MKRNSQAVRIKDIETLSDAKGKLTSVTFEQRRRSGDWQQRKREIYDNGNSAVVLPYDFDRGTALLTRQLRLPIYLQDGVERSVEIAWSGGTASKLNGEWRLRSS